MTGYVPKWSFLPPVEDGYRSDYFRKHHDQWRNMKRFAYNARMTLGDARIYIDAKLLEWYDYVGLSSDAQPVIRVRRARRRKRDHTAVWRNDDAQD